MNTELIRRALRLGLANTVSVAITWPALSDFYQDEAETINQALAELDRATNSRERQEGGAE